MKKMIVVVMMAMIALVVNARNITGKVVDENNVPFEFVNVVVISQADSAFVAGTITDADGVFDMETMQDNGVLVKVSSIGYATLMMDVPSSGDLGTIMMSPKGIELGEVVVKSDRPVTAIKGGALMTTVAGSQLEHAGTANDVLTQVPMILGRDGSFEVFGKGSPAIYVNGRKLQNMEELSQLSSGDIKNVEVVTNPGAKYDASVKSIIRIRTKRPQGEGFSGTLRAQGAVQNYFRTVDQANFKFRTGGLELFLRSGYINGKFQAGQRVDMVTQSSHVWNQSLIQDGAMRSNEFFGTAGFSYMFNEDHSIGAYYSNGFNKWKSDHTGISQVAVDGAPYDKLIMKRQAQINTLPKHNINLYYNGKVGKMDIDFNMDYMWRKSKDDVMSNETSKMHESQIINSLGVNRSRLLAEKLVLSYPLWKGGVEIGEEYTSSRFSSDYTTDATIVNDANSCVDENNMAGFAEIGQTFGPINIGAGLRYEHVNFDYQENGQKKEAQSKSYNNVFPSLSLSTEIKNVQLNLNYSHKTQRPGYSDLSGTVDYINRFTLESGNPYLQPEKIHTVEFTGAWRRFFGQISYSYKKDPIMNTTRPYSDDAEIKLITMDNFPKIQSVQAFAGAQFQMGIWQPKINVGIMKQWLSIDYDNGRKNLDKPIGLVQFQNAIHLPLDMWMNVNMQWMSAGNESNMYQTSSSYIDMKLYKAFFNNSFSVSVEANDIFNKGNRDVTLLNKDVTMFKSNIVNNRTFMLTLQYTFNTSRDRYKGKGAGTEEMSRF